MWLILLFINFVIIYFYFFHKKETFENDEDEAAQIYKDLKLETDKDIILEDNIIEDSGSGRNQEQALIYIMDKYSEFFERLNSKLDKSVTYYAAIEARMRKVTSDIDALTGRESTIGTQREISNETSNETSDDTTKK